MSDFASFLGARFRPAWPCLRAGSAGRALLLALGCAAAPAWGHVSAPITILAGSGLSGPQDGPGGQARFDSPTALALDLRGKTLWVLDQNNTAIRKVSLDLQRTVATLKLDEQSKKSVESCSELASIPWNSDLAMLCRQGKRIVELEGLSGVARSRQLYSGNALSQLTVTDNPKRFWALDPGNGRLMEAGYSPTGDLRFSDAQEGVGFTALAACGSTLAAYRQVASVVLCVYQMTTATANGLSTTSETAVTDLPGHGPLRMAYASYDDGETKAYLWEPGGIGLYRVEGNQLRPLEVPNAEGANLNNGNRMPYYRLNGLAVDDDRRFLYLSDALDNRVLRLQDGDYNLGGFGEGSRRMENDFAYSLTKPDDVRRNLFYGGSYAYFTLASSGKFYNLNKRVEYYLNLKSLAAAAPYGIQVLFDGAPLAGAGYSGDVLSFATTRVAARKDCQADFYAVAISPLDLFFCGLSYLNRPLNEKGVPTDRFDPEYALDSPVARYKGLAADLYKEISGHAGDFAPGLTMDPKGHLLYDPNVANLYGHFGANHFTHVLEACTNGLLEAFSQQIQQISPGAKLFVILSPQRNFLGFQETVQDARFHKMDTVAEFSWRPFQDLNKDPNIIELNVDDPIKAESVSYFPVFYPNDHMDQGTDIAGFLAAEMMWPSITSDPKAGF